ncbi:hypothetical protein WVIC16_50056 [Weissella viridescens]|nr:hypothetical protein WVIC16_50056 [Weissella viridescens]
MIQNGENGSIELNLQGYFGILTVKFYLCELNMLQLYENL